MTSSPLEVLHAYGRRYPDAWRQFDEFRARRDELGGWPDWCFCPMAGAYAIASGGGSRTVEIERGDHVGALAALAAWRPTQGVYRLHPRVFEDVWGSRIAGDLPVEVLEHLPEWCCYVALPDAHLLGFWVHLEHDANTGRRELRLALHVGGPGGVVPMAVHLVGTLEASVQAAVDEATANAALAGRTVEASAIAAQLEAITRTAEPMVAVALYLCTDDAEIVDAAGEPIRRPNRPAPAKAKKGRPPRLHAAKTVTEWRVGDRLGAAMEAALNDGGHGVKPHIRRGHWHTYRTGEGRQGKRVRWVASMAVGAEKST